VPTYQYACKACGEQLEAVQKFTDEPLTVCPNCGGELRKVFSAVGVVFKGSGFYRTDSRSASASSASSSSGSTGKESSASTSGSAAKDGASSTPNASSTATKDSGSAA
jgi:putative FmdB family regulatory protein